MEIRMITESDAEKFLELSKKLDQETRFMMLEPGERNTTVEEQENQLRQLLTSGNSMIFVAEREETGELVGYIGLFGGRYIRISHCAHIVMGILENYRGQGLGKAFMQTAEQWARDTGIRRLELSVVTDNEVAIALYTKTGFEVEGLKKRSLLIDSRFVDEYYMVKLID
ncbi:MAG: GNAT family N-acetyltransferase [Firmicutes bacterium]|nr:GNAT family N-acetyltransferase [Bacillota bacterium]